MTDQKVDFLQLLVIAVLWLLIIASASEKMAAVLLQIVENHYVQYFVAVYHTPFNDGIGDFS